MRSTAAVAVRRGQERVAPAGCARRWRHSPRRDRNSRARGFQTPALFAGKGERPLPRRPHRQRACPRCREPHRAAVQLLPAEAAARCARSAAGSKLHRIARTIMPRCAFPPFDRALRVRGKSSSCSRTESHSAFIRRQNRLERHRRYAIAAETRAEARPASAAQSPPSAAFHPRTARPQTARFRFSSMTGTAPHAVSPCIRTASTARARIFSRAQSMRTAPCRAGERLYIKSSAITVASFANISCHIEYTLARARAVKPRPARQN